MSFVVQKRHGGERLYFVAGRHGRYYLHTKNRPDKVNVTNIKKSLEYIQKKKSHYSDIENELVKKLPQKERDEYILERLIQLDQVSDISINVLSSINKEKYIEKRLRDLQKIQYSL